MTSRRTTIFWLLLFVTTFTCIYLSYVFVQSLREWRADQITKSVIKRHGMALSSEEFAQEYISLYKRRSKMEKISSHFHYFFTSKKFTQKKKNILIAVVTTEKYLVTRAVAINRTWAREVKGKNQLYFFVGENCNINDHRLQGMPIVKIKGIKDNLYPPQKKVFAVLKYINNNYGEQYRWVVRADDDVYIRVPTLHDVLGELDWTEKLILGHPGWGKTEDRNRLKLLPHENYCMGGPGIVFSATALKDLTPYLDKCLEGVNLYNKQHSHAEGWYNEDVELGRCISRTLGIGCTNLPLEYDEWTENSYFIHLNPRALNMDALWTKPALLTAISIHPFKNPDIMFRIHHFFKLKDYHSLSTQIDYAATELKQICSKLPKQMDAKGSQFRECFYQ